MSQQNKSKIEGENYMSNFKSGFVSIIGRTNVGKSTLINSLAHEKNCNNCK